MKAKMRFGQAGQWAAKIVRMILWSPSAKAPEPVQKAVQPVQQAIPQKPELSAAAEAKLLEELRAAHLEWACARHRFHYALETDEIDYAIFALETAEKRYGMLIKQAKMMNIRASHAFRPSLCWLEPNGRGD